MPLEAAEGGITLAEEHFRQMLANCARFRTWCREDTVERALVRIYSDTLPPPASGAGVHTKEELAKYRPFAILWTDEQAGYTRTRVATDCYAESGTIGVQFEQAVPDHEAGDGQQLMRKFKNHLGVMMSELEELAYQAGYLAFDEQRVQGPWREDIKAAVQQGDHLFAFLTFRWGVES